MMVQVQIPSRSREDVEHTVTVDLDGDCTCEAFTYRNRRLLTGEPWCAHLDILVEALGVRQEP